MATEASDDHVTRIERQLEVAQQITHIGSWEWSAATNQVTWSDELYRIYGFEPRSQTIDFEFFLSRVHPNDRAQIHAKVGAALEHGGRFSYEERIIRPDGTVRQLSTVGESIDDGKGRRLGLIGTCRDVTDERARDEQMRFFAELVKNVQIALGVWSVGDANDPSSIRLLAYNPAAERIARADLSGAIGKPLSEILPYARGGTLQGLLLKVAADGQVREDVVIGSRDPGHPARSVSMKVFPMAGGQIGVAIEDITESMLTRRLQAAEQRILEMIAEGTPLREILSRIVLAIEDHSPPAIGSILLVDADGARIRHGAAPHLPAAYVKAIDGQRVGPKAGSCGTAVFTKKPVFVSDISKDPLWEDYREVALANGLRACWSTPILSTEGRVLGTFAVYHHEPRAVTQIDLVTIERISHLAGIAIERRELEDQLRALSAHVESIREDERTGIAREIHDELGQALTALKMDLAWIARRAGVAGTHPGTLNANPLTPEMLLEKLKAMSAMTDEVIEQVRRISAELRPGVLDDLGLVAAIEWQSSEFEKRTGVSVVFASALEDVTLDRETSTAAFRIFQEALTNVARHAEATRVDVRLDVKDGVLSLEVQDDGKGILPDMTHNPRSLGLLGIRERARRLDGTAKVQAASPKGTLVSLSVPVSRSLST